MFNSFLFLFLYLYLYLYNILYKMEILDTVKSFGGITASNCITLTFPPSHWCL